MNPQLILAVITASGILLSSALLPFQTSEIYADESETNTDQGLSQKNAGSGDSTSINCGHNSIDNIANTLVCREVSPPPPTSPPTSFPPGTTVLLTLEQGCFNTLSCTVDFPEEFSLFECLELPDSDLSCRAFLRTGESVALTDCVFFGRQVLCRVA
jgi:hypothetical protein